jgi:adenosylhomocysteinase
MVVLTARGDTRVVRRIFNALGPLPRAAEAPQRTAGPITDFDVFNQPRAEFLKRISAKYLAPRVTPKARVVLVTHLLPDRPALLEALSAHCRIDAVIAIPYSADRRVVAWADERFDVLEPTLDELLGGSPLVDALCAERTSDTVLMEIGGYGSNSLRAVAGALGARFRGVIEGTESGIARYRTAGDPPVPVLGMSMSPTKGAESSLVGTACLFSVESALRKIGFTNETRTAAVLGFGRVGRSAAAACRARGMQVLVWDPQMDRRVAALAEGYAIPERDACLANADLILGAAGRRSWSPQDIDATRDGAILASCSSKDVEFEVDAMRSAFACRDLSDDVCTVSASGKRFHFLYNGRPVNFRDGANLGPILTLLQGEMLLALAELFGGDHRPGIGSPDPVGRLGVVEDWLRDYVDPARGWYARREP